MKIKKPTFFLITGFTLGNPISMFSQVQMSWSSALMLSMRQASAGNTKLWNFMTIFGTNMRNTFGISANMPVVGSLIHDISVKNVRNVRKQTKFCSVKPIPML